MKRYWWLLIVPALLLLWWAFSRRDPTATVHFSSVRVSRIASVIPTNGKVEPAEWSAVVSETSGVIRSINVSRGQSVKANQLLITLDSISVRADLAAAIAREQEARAQQNTLGGGGKAATVADLNDRIASAEAGRQIAQRIYDSDKRLFARQAVTKLQVDNDADALERARQNLDALKNQKRTAVTAGDRAVAGAKLLDAKQAVVLARHRVQLAEIRSPSSGTVYEFNLKVGAYLQPGASVAKIGNLDQVKVIVYVDEPDLGRINLNLPVTITSQSRPGQKWQGRVDKLPTEVVPLATRTVGEVSTMIDNPQHDLLPGVSVDASILSKVVSDALVIPKTALRRIGNADGVFKLAGEILKWTPVQTGISDINNVQILSGLQARDEVADRAVDPADTELRNGMRANPVFN